MVTANATPNDSVIRPGMEILTIDGHVVDDLIARIMPTLRRDGFITQGAERAQIVGRHHDVPGG